MQNKLVALFILITILTYTKLCPSVMSASLDEITKTETIDAITSSKESEQRTYPRFENRKLKSPVVLERNNPNISEIINISRGGVGIKHNNTLHPDDIIALNLIYKDISIKTEARVVFSRDNIAGAEFIQDDTETFNKLLYMSVRLEADNGMLVTKLSDG